MQQLCSDDGQCWFMYRCVEGYCQHQPLLPLTAYNTFVYILIPFLVALSNLAGISSGFLKFILFMDLLNFTEIQATILAYPIIFGGGLANFFLLVRAKNPLKQGPLINYNVANVILPCVVIGTTFGSLTNSLIPQLILDVISVIVCLVLALMYYFQLKDYISQRKIDQGQLKKLLPSRYKSPKKKEKNLELVEIEQEAGQDSDIEQNISDITPAMKKQMRDEVIQQQSISIPIKQILFSFFFFSIIEVASLMLQGRIIPFSICQGLGAIALPLLLLVLIIIQICYYFLNLKPKYTKIEEFKLRSQIDLGMGKNVIIICVGTFIGGFSTGLIALGCGHIMILTLVYLRMNQKTASATSGYQIVFIGTASTLEAILFGYLSWQDFLFLSILAFIGSFCLTIIGQHYLGAMNDKGIGLIIIILIIIIGLSLLGIIVSMSLALTHFGIHKMMIPSGLDC